MGFPDRIERTVRIARPVDDVWAAITSAEGLGTWFGQRAEVDLRVGGIATVAWDSGERSQLRIERLEPKTIFGYTWPVHGLPADDPRRTYVEFTLNPDGDGTSLTVVETGFAQLGPDEHDVAFAGNTRGWASELDELVAYLHD
ncbi:MULTISPECIES: SRPBCC domain-containing protein [Micromonospora]|uniref:ATPase n=1 Tax=Micromonospora craniellae TaxID=2294034 RepID=A0A372FTC6_9ACTN|nr:SRPBCC domain-containing protein [Micromonospora craniellae]QOC93975.1 SRPBCC domain-containing protein [Micromonospora craniellae]RFS44042.1 ATPase [Micromonospora craniellae]